MLFCFKSSNTANIILYVPSQEIHHFLHEQLNLYSPYHNFLLPCSPYVFKIPFILKSSCLFIFTMQKRYLILTNILQIRQ